MVSVDVRRIEGAFLSGFDRGGAVSETVSTAAPGLAALKIGRSPAAAAAARARPTLSATHFSPDTASVAGTAASSMRSGGSEIGGVVRCAAGACFFGRREYLKKLL